MSTDRLQIATKRAAAELAAHRRRLLELADEPELDASDAILLRVAPGAGADFPPTSPSDFPTPPLATDLMDAEPSALRATLRHNVDSPLSVGEGFSSLDPQESH